MPLPFCSHFSQKITVVIPAFNASDSIIRTLDSVVAQTLKPVEVIIIDDGSSDGTHDTISNYIDINNLSSWRLLSQSNGGPAKARDKAIRFATGSHIALLDSDDEWLPEKLAVTLAHLIALKLDIIGAPHKMRKSTDTCRIINPKEVLFINPYFTSTVIFSREAYIDVGGFNLSQRYSEDYRLWLAFSWLGKRCGQMSLPYTLYHPAISSVHKGLSSHLWRMQSNELANFRWLRLCGVAPAGWCLVAQMFSWLKFIRRVFQNL